MSTISGVVIAKNEEKMIADCLDSITFCDEIILIDDNSHDKTSEIAKRMNAKVYETDMSDFSKLRNLGLSKTTSDWIFYVDADERVSNELREQIKEKIQKEEFDAYEIQRKNFYLGQNPWPKIENMARLFKKNAIKGWTGKLHETPRFEGKIGKLSGYLLHYTHRDLASMLAKTIEWSDVEAKTRFEANHPKMSLWRFPRVMVTSFLSSYIGQKGYRLGTIGLVESMFQSFSAFITYAKLWELQNKSS